MSLTLDLICGPDPAPEYRECPRCGIRMNPTSLIPECNDCKSVNSYKATIGQQKLIRGNFLPVEPAYEVALHYPVIPREDPTARTLTCMKIPYFSYYAAKDPIEVQYARNLESSDFEPKWPIVLITSHGEYVDHWTGFDLAKLNAIPAARSAALQTTETHKADQRGVPIEQEKAA